MALAATCAASFSYPSACSSTSKHRECTRICSTAPDRNVSHAASITWHRCSRTHRSDGTPCQHCLPGGSSRPWRVKCSSQPRSLQQTQPHTAFPPSLLVLCHEACQWTRWGSRCAPKRLAEHPGKLWQHEKRFPMFGQPAASSRLHRSRAHMSRVMV